MRIFISGGCRNGKSYYAQYLAKLQQTTDLYYIATMRPTDNEDRNRIIKHQNERKGWGFTTVELFSDIESILYGYDLKASFLLDSLTALLANEMFLPENIINENASEKIICAISNILKNIDNIVIVSDYIYGDAYLYDTLTEKYRSSLAKIDRMIAKYCDIVLEASYSNIIVHKGNHKFLEIQNGRYAQLN